MPNVKPIPGLSFGIWQSAFGIHIDTPALCIETIQSGV
jgi:hypothetical protein